MKYPRLVELLSKPEKYDSVLVRGWVRTFRANRFIALNDGAGNSDYGKTFESCGNIVKDARECRGQ